MAIARSVRPQGPWTVCIVEGCGELSQTRYGRWCVEHLARYRRHGDPLISLGAGRREEHGQAKARTPTYRSWVAMRTRCHNPRRAAYPDYGGRGISICARWNSFECFAEDMGERPEGTTLDRIDVEGNYEPSNCRWATPSQQRRNQRIRTDSTRTELSGSGGETQ